MKSSKTMMFGVILAAVLLAGVLPGCGRKYEPKVTGGGGQSETLNLTVETAQGQTAPEESSLTEETGSTPQETVENKDPGDEDFSFADVDGMEFDFTSGAGGWYEVLHIKGDGTFTGHFQDSDMGDTGDDHPNGTMFYSDYNGSFTEPEKVDDTTYRFRIARIDYPFEEKEKIIDGTLYCFTATYGLGEAQDIYLYLPESKITDLPEMFLNWVGVRGTEAASREELGFYGLYNEHAETGFRSYKYEPEPSAGEATTGEKPGLTVSALIDQAEASAAVLEESLQNGGMSQADLNDTYQEIYRIWDDTLNAVWAILKDNLDEESMANITAEERAWIAEKEQAVQEAAAEYEGGSMQPLAANSTAAEMTKERVYELAKYVNVWR